LPLVDPHVFILSLKTSSDTPTSLSCTLFTLSYVPTHFLSPIHSIPFMVKYSLLFANFTLILSSSCLQSSTQSAIGHCPIPVICRTQTRLFPSSLLSCHMYCSPSIVFTSTNHPSPLPHLVISVQFYINSYFFHS